MPEKLICKCTIVGTSISQLRQLQVGSLNLQNDALQTVVYFKGLARKTAVESEDASHGTE